MVVSDITVIYRYILLSLVLFKKQPVMHNNIKNTC